MMLENFPLDIDSIPLVHRGKVRDIYQLDDQHWLMVASNRLSAFDVVLPNTLEGKGAILSEISQFWFDLTRHIVQNHCVSLDICDYITASEYRKVQDRAVTVKRLQPLPVEAIVRGYLIGSGWTEYQQKNTICQIPLPTGLRQASRLEHPIYTPSTKAAPGQHDENISYQQTIDLLGEQRAEQVREVSLALYQFAYNYAYERGIIIADTKFEFGLDEHNNLVLMDELLTPDSSRFWDKESYHVDSSPPSFDKQIVRDYLQTLSWNKAYPGPTLPEEITQKTLARYQQVANILQASTTPNA